MCVFACSKQRTTSSCKLRNTSTFFEIRTLTAWNLQIKLDWLVRVLGSSYLCFPLGLQWMLACLTFFTWVLGAEIQVLKLVRQTHYHLHLWPRPPGNILKNFLKILLGAEKRCPSSEEHYLATTRTGVRILSPQNDSQNTCDLSSEATRRQLGLLPSNLEDTKSRFRGSVSKEWVIVMEEDNTLVLPCLRHALRYAHTN